MDWVACQAPLPLEFSRQKYWNGLPFPSLDDLPNPGTKPMSLESPTLAGEALINLVYIKTDPTES